MLAWIWIIGIVIVISLCLAAMFRGNGTVN